MSIKIIKVEKGYEYRYKGFNVLSDKPIEAIVVDFEKEEK